MPEQEPPIHERCIQHPLKCKSIADLQASQEKAHEEHIRIWDRLGATMKTKTLLSLIGLLITIFLALFGFSIQMNKTAIEGSQGRHNEQQHSVDRIMDSQHKTEMSIISIQGTLHEVRSDVEELKENRYKR